MHAADCVHSCNGTIQTNRAATHHMVVQAHVINILQSDMWVTQHAF